jgi:hypothetical protein
MITSNLALLLGIYLITCVAFLYSCQNVFTKEVTAESSREPEHYYDSVGQTFHSKEDYSSKIEGEIRSGKTSSARLIVSEHPRIWIKGRWDWKKDNVGSLAWRIVHGSGCRAEDPGCDDMKQEFYYISAHSDTVMYGQAKNPTYGLRYLWSILAAEGLTRRKEWRLPHSLPGSGLHYDPRHTADELLADARLKLLTYVGVWDGYVGAHSALHGAAGYDWLGDRKYSDGVTPVLSSADKAVIQNRLIALAEKMKEDCKGQGQLFGRADHIYKYFYPIIGMALYEPDGMGISLENNAKAKEFLDDFDRYWVGTIIPALNEQGGTGGWHGGTGYVYGEYPAWGYHGESTQYDVLPYRVAQLLYAHYTATGQPLEDSVYNTGFLKYSGEFWNYMIYPNNRYLEIGRQCEGRYTWIAPMFPNARRRFSNDPYNRWVAELVGWVRNTKAPSAYVNAGSYDLFDQLMWEEKWPSARSATKLGCGTRHFAKLGWIAMRSGFTSSDDLAALFICQRYHWSQLDPYAQNSFTVERKEKLIKEFEAPILIDATGQRRITSFPTVSQGVGAYSPGSTYDVGPGIMAFESKEKYDYMKGDASRAYDSKKLSKFTRQVVWLKPNLFIIFDVVVGTSANYTKSWVITTGAMPVERGSNTNLIDNGSNSLWIKTLLPEDPVVLSRTASRFELKPKVTQANDYFLNVLEIANKGASIPIDGSYLVESQEGHKILGAYVPQRAVIIFSKNGEPIKRTTFSLKGIDTGKILIVVDLLPSTAYTITKDSQEFKVGSSDQGVVFLEIALSGSRSISLSKST